jgi:BirA family biotin operon repressor/biotin-[acetyl-CoA-carboxylase] ligase
MRLLRSLAILFTLSVFPAAINSAGPPDARTSEISLDRVWLHSARGKQNLRSLEPKYFPTREAGREYSTEELKELRRKARKSLNMQLERAMAAMKPASDGEKRPIGFAVKGAGREALQGAYDVLVKGNPPKAKFDSASGVSVVFYSLPQQPYVGLDRSRGRLGRQWQSPRGGAWMSLVWPKSHKPEAYGAVSLLAAVAVLRAIGELVPECADRLQVKWPNDVLLNGRKTAGILCEQTLDVTRKSQGTLIIGAGVNVDFDVAVLPAALRHPATTLRRESNRSVAVEDVIWAVSERLVQLLTQFEGEGFSENLVQELQSRLAYVGSVRSVELAGNTITGRIAGIDQTGRLVIQGVDGSMVFASGELVGHEGAADRTG